jgi:glycerophosphoryl diester phosphodiesterase
MKLFGTNTKGKFKGRHILVLLLIFTLSVNAQTISPEAKKVQQLIPENAVIAHRGTIYWAPELTEAAFRWGRNSGADYLELDVQRTKDGILVVIHDKTLKRTTNIVQKFPGRENDPISTFTLEEILQLDAGSAFNKKNPEQARKSFSALNILVFEDVFRIAEGKRIKRNAEGHRIFHKTDDGKYIFEYEKDPADNGNRPGVYIETKSPENYPGIEKQIFQELSAFGWNPLAGEASKCYNPFYIEGKVNTGNTKGKILIQTFSRPGMKNFQQYFKGQVPTSFLIKSHKFEGPDIESTMDEIIDFAHQTGAQFIGTNVVLKEGHVNNQVFLEKIQEAGLKVNIFSFNTIAQIEKYFAPDTEGKVTPLINGMITNRTDLTTRFYYEQGARKIKPGRAPQKILDDLGYIR